MLPTRVLKSSSVRPDTCSVSRITTSTHDAPARTLLMPVGVEESWRDATRRLIPVWLFTSLIACAAWLAPQATIPEAVSANTHLLFVVGFVGIAWMHRDVAAGSRRYVVLALSGAGVLLLTGMMLYDPGARSALTIPLLSTIGALIARMIPRVSWGMTAAVLAAAVDVWSVYSQHGITRALIEQAESTSTASQEAPLISYIMLVFPTLGDATPLLLGFVDIVLASMLIAVAHVFVLGSVRVAFAIVTGIMITMWISDAIQAGLPAIPLIAAGFLVATCSFMLPQRRRVPVHRPSR